MQAMPVECGKTITLDREEIHDEITRQNDLWRITWAGYADN
jgi:hypothetical protein